MKVILGLKRLVFNTLYTIGYDVISEVKNSAFIQLLNRENGQIYVWVVRYNHKSALQTIVLLNIQYPGLVWYLKLKLFLNVNYY